MKGGKIVLKQVNILQRFGKIIATELGSTCPSCSKVNLLTAGFGEDKYSVYCRMSSKKDEQLTLKKTQTPCWISGKGFFKAALEVRVAGCLSNSWTFFCFVGDEITGSCFRNLSHQPSGSN